MASIQAGHEIISGTSLLQQAVELAIEYQQGRDSSAVFPRITPEELR